MTFRKFLKRFREHISLYGEFSRDVLHDRDFPRYSKRKYPSLTDYHSVIMRYLYEENADREALNVFESIWQEYLQEI